MKHLSFIGKKTIFIITAVIFGAFLFFSASLFFTNRILLSPEFHQELFAKNDIYYTAQNTLQGSFDNLYNQIIGASSEDSIQQNEFISLLKNSITPQLIKMNIDNLTIGLFEYVKGSTVFLPDIHLDFQNISSDPSDSGSPVGLLSPESLSKIDKINLSTLLIYFDKTSFLNILDLLKLFYFISHLMPQIVLIIFIFIICLVYLIIKKFHYCIIWLGLVFLSCAVLLISSGALLALFRSSSSREYISLLFTHFPLQPETLSVYIADCLAPISMALILSGISLLAIALALMLSLHFIRNRLPKLHFISAQYLKKTGPTAKYAALGILFIMLFTVVSMNVLSIQKTFARNNLYDLISKIRNSGKVAQVISAKDETIYAIQAKLINPKNEEPIPDININIQGYSSHTGKFFYEKGATDEKGITKFVLDKGRYWISFEPSQFPSVYSMPAPFLVDLTAPGTSIITVNLDSIAEKRTGIAEIEILDEKNSPIPHLKLAVEDIEEHKKPGTMYSYTNSEGIGIFKLISGQYKIKISRAGFPKKYILPQSFDVEILPDTASRYTIRLAEAAK